MSFLIENVDGSTLSEYSDKWVRSGFFVSLEDVAEAVDIGFNEKIADKKKHEKGDYLIKIESEINPVFARAYMDSAAAYVRRVLTESETENLISLIDSRLRPKLYPKS